MAQIDKFVFVALLVGFAHLLAPPRAVAQAPFIRGDVDANRVFDVSDPIFILTWQFIGGEVPPCVDAADSNDNGTVDLTDAVYTLHWLFLGGEPPPPPHPGCGFDPTIDDLGCEHFPLCRLGIELELSERLVEDSSVEIIVHLPADTPGEVVLLVDGQIVSQRKPLSRFVLNTLDLEDGEHSVAAAISGPDGFEIRAEEPFEVHNPTAVVRSFEAPEVVWPDSEVVIFVETAGEVESLAVDLFGLFERELPEVIVERLEENLFRLSFIIPPFDVDLVEEGRRVIPIEVIGRDRRGYRFDGIELFLARAETLPLSSERGILRLRSLSFKQNDEARTRIVHMDPDLALEPGGASSVLHVVVEGETAGAVVFLSAEEHSGHLAVPLDGLEPIEEDGEIHVFAIPIQALTKPGDKNQLLLVASMQDPLGYASVFDNPAFLELVEEVPRYSVYGQVRHQYTDRTGVTAIGMLDGLSVHVLDKTGSEVASGVVAWNGRFRIKFPQETLTNLPYSIELRTEEPEAKVVTSGTAVVHSYKHPVTFSPTDFNPHELNITVPLADSGAFHIFRVLRRANVWYRVHGMSIGQTVVVWNSGYKPVPTSHYDDGTDQIHLLGHSSDPDEYDDSVILHEVSHRATGILSRDDSPGGTHSRKTRSVATLAWSEGIATYLGQTILADRRYVDMSAKGSYDYNVDDLTNVPIGTDDGTESGKLSEGLVTAFLWDLRDPVASSENDNLSGLESQTLKNYKNLKSTSNLSSGVDKKVDLADFVRLSGCGLSSTLKNNMHTLLSKRFSLDWLKSDGFCD